MLGGRWLRLRNGLGHLCRDELLRVVEAHHVKRGKVTAQIVDVVRLLFSLFGFFLLDQFGVLGYRLWVGRRWWRGLFAGP